jgi:hypothetical protein
VLASVELKAGIMPATQNFIKNKLFQLIKWLVGRSDAQWGEGMMLRFFATVFSETRSAVDFILLIYS